MRPIAWLDSGALDGLPPDRFRWIAVGRARGLTMHAGRGIMPLLATVPTGAGRVAVVFVDPERVVLDVLVDRRDLSERLTVLARQLGALRSLPAPQQQRHATDVLLRFHARAAGRELPRARVAVAPRTPHPPPVLLGYAFVQHLGRRMAARTAVP